MIAFEVKDMSCNHCVGAITRAIQEVDAGAQVRTELDTHRVLVGAASIPASGLENAIREAGYTPVRLADFAETGGAPAAKGCGGGCGCR